MTFVSSEEWMAFNRGLEAFVDDDLVYKKPRKGPAPGPSTDSQLPTLAALQEKQRSELIEMAQVRYGIKGSKIQVNLTPLLLHSAMSEGQIFKELLRRMNGIQQGIGGFCGWWLGV